MKAIFSQVIRAGEFDLPTLLRNVDTYHIQGKLTDAERDELYASAREAAKPVYDPTTEIEKLWAAVKALQKRLAGVGTSSGGTSGDGSDSGDGKDAPASTDWPEYVQPTGAHDAYMNGDRITYGGKHYICLMDSCVWGPDVYPAGWQEVLDDGGDDNTADDDTAVNDDDTAVNDDNAAANDDTANDNTGLKNDEGLVEEM